MVPICSQKNDTWAAAMILKKEPRKAMSRRANRLHESLAGSIFEKSQMGLVNGTVVCVRIMAVTRRFRLCTKLHRYRCVLCCIRKIDADVAGSYALPCLWCYIPWPEAHLDTQVKTSATPFADFETSLMSLVSCIFAVAIPVLTCLNVGIRLLQMTCAGVILETAFTMQHVRSNDKRFTIHPSTPTSLPQCAASPLLVVCSAFP